MQMPQELPPDSLIGTTPPANDSHSSVSPARRKSARWVILALVVVFVAGGGVWLWAQVPGQGHGPQPSIGRITVAPSIIPVNTPTTVLVTAVIDTPTLNPASVELLRVADTGNVAGDLGRMYDDGTNGDAIPGDKKFSRSITLTERTTGTVSFNVSAAFRGVLRQIVSSPITISIWSVLNTAELRVLVPDGFEAQSSSTVIDGTSVDILDLSPSEASLADRGMVLSVSHLLTPLVSLDDLETDSVSSQVVSRDFIEIKGHQWLRIKEQTPDGGAVSYHHLATSTKLITLSGFGRFASDSESLLEMVIEGLAF